MLFFPLQKILSWDVNKDDLLKMFSDEVHIPVNKIRRLGVSDCQQLFSRPSTRSRLFPDDIVATGMWLPFATNEDSLKNVTRCCNVSASFGADNITCESVTFATALKGAKATRVDIWVYGPRVPTRIVLAHVYYWLRQLKDVFNVDVSPIMLQVYFPTDVDVAEVKNHLSAKFGPVMFSPTFDCDEMIYVSRPLYSESKL